MLYVFQRALVEQALQNRNGINRLHQKIVGKLAQIVILMGISLCYVP